MKVTIFRDVDATTKDGLVTLLEAVKCGFGFRPVGEFQRQTTVPSRNGKRRKRARRGVYKIEGELGARIVKLRQQGVSYPAIAKTVGLSPSGVAHYLKREKVQAK